MSEVKHPNTQGSSAACFPILRCLVQYFCQEHGAATHDPSTAAQHGDVIPLYPVHFQTHTTTFLQLVHPYKWSKISEVKRDSVARSGLDPRGSAITCSSTTCHIWRFIWRRKLLSPLKNELSLILTSLDSSLGQRIKAEAFSWAIWSLILVAKIRDQTQTSDQWAEKVFYSLQSDKSRISFPKCRGVKNKRQI